MLIVLGWIAVVASAGIAAFWLLVLSRVVHTARTMPHVRDGLGQPAPETGWPMVSVIVPAHNEQRVIDRCASALRAQDYANLEIIFVLDRCVDATASILAPHAEADSRVRVIINEACPEDWAGKCNAARRGAEVARGEWLLFTDADTSFDQALVRAAVGSALRRRLGLLSLLGRLTTRHWFERVVQPVASMNLIRMYPIGRANRAPGGPRRARPFANGQFLLFDRAVYERVGGHAAVKDDLLEDIAFARLVHERGYGTGIELAADLLTVAMYDSFRSFRTGWKRIFIEACKRKPTRLRENAWRCLATGVAFPLVQAGAFLLAWMLAGQGVLPVALIGVAAFGLVMQAITLACIYRLQGTPIIGALLYPVGCVVVAREMMAGASDLERRLPVRWGGRSYVLTPR